MERQGEVFLIPISSGKDHLVVLKCGTPLIEKESVRSVLYNTHSAYIMFCTLTVI